jgi:hypothetical protein
VSSGSQPTSTCSSLGVQIFVQFPYGVFLWSLHLFYSLFFQLDLETGVLYKTVEGILAIIGKEDALVVAYFLLYHGMRQVTCVLYMLINSSYQHLFMICVALVDF